MRRIIPNHTSFWVLVTVPTPLEHMFHNVFFSRSWNVRRRLHCFFWFTIRRRINGICHAIPFGTHISVHEERLTTRVGQEHVDCCHYHEGSQDCRDHNRRGTLSTHSHDHNYVLSSSRVCKAKGKSKLRYGGTNGASKIKLP